MRNPVLEELRLTSKKVSRHPGGNELQSSLEILESKLQGWKEKKVEYHLHKGGGLEKVRRWGDGVVYITKSRGSRKYKLQNKRI